MVDSWSSINYTWKCPNSLCRETRACLRIATGGCTDKRACDEFKKQKKQFITELNDLYSSVSTKISKESSSYSEIAKEKPSEHKISETVNHPAHYGDEDDVYEAIKVITAWKLGFNLGNTLKYIKRADKKGNRKENLQKALFYLQYEIDNTENKNV